MTFTEFTLVVTTVSLHFWLEDIDLKHYEQKLNSLGVRKFKHLIDVTKNDLTEMVKMLKLEIWRFKHKVTETFPAYP